MIWLVGSKGMLGTELALLMDSYGIPYTGTDSELDITDRKELFLFAGNQKKPADWIINCAAYTAVDKAEDDSENCRLVNAAGAGNIAWVANKIGARLIHISSDYVFNGNGNRPYKEEDVADPIGVYGFTKREGEIIALKENTRSYIFRTAWLYGKYGKNFVHTMLALMKDRENISVVNDQRGSPTWTFDLAEVIITLLRSSDTGSVIPYGIYHYTNEGEITWFDFACEIFTQSRALGILNKDCKVLPCTGADFPARVQRPAYSVLDKTKIKTALGITIPEWNNSLGKFLNSGDYGKCVS